MKKKKKYPKKYTHKTLEIHICKGCAKLEVKEVHDSWNSLSLSVDNHEWFNFPMSLEVHCERLLRKTNICKINGKACKLEIENYWTTFS